MSASRMLAWKAACFGVLLIAWEIFAVSQRNLNLFPTLESILGASLPSLGVFSDHGSAGFTYAIGALAYHAGLTIARIAAGLAIGAPLGLAFGLLMHWLRGDGGTPALTLIITRSIPLLALIPLFSFWFGASSSGVIAYIAFGVFVVIASDAYEASANVPPAFLQSASLLGARRLFLMRTVHLPGIASHMAGSIRNVVGLSWALSLGAEYISATSGLGYITYQSYLFTDMGKLAVLAFVYMALGYTSFILTGRYITPAMSWEFATEKGRDEKTH